MRLPPDDQPDTIDVGPVTSIPILQDDDPRLTEDHARWSAAIKKAQALHSADELLSGLDDQDWRVRHECIDRLIARARDDNRSLPALIGLATSDEAWQVRDAIVMRLCEFDPDMVSGTLRAATRDPHSEVRLSAAYSLRQLGAK